MDNYILIDGSYYCFYRYFALLNWWKMAHDEEQLSIPFENELFVEKFKSTFIDKIKEIPKKLKIKGAKIIVAKIVLDKIYGELIIWKSTKPLEYMMIHLWVAHSLS